MNSKGERTREQILEKAAALFHRNGFSATSISDLTRAAGVTKGSIYFHFPGKNDIALAVLERAETQFMAFLDAALDGPTPGARLDSFFHEALEIHRRSGFVGGCLFGNTALEASDSNPLYADRVSEIFDRWIERLERIVAEGQSAGELRQDVPALQLAQCIVSTLEGGIMLSRLCKAEEPLRRSLDSLRVLLQVEAGFPGAREQG